MKKLVAILAALASLALAAQAPAAPAAKAAPEAKSAARVSGDWVGRVRGSGLYVAVEVDKNGNVLAYVCDGKNGKAATWWAWFEGKASRNAIDLRSRGYRLRADLTRGWAKGTITLPNRRVLHFDARPARGTAGLYRLNTAFSGKKLVGGWIFLNDGSVRGRCTGCDPKVSAAIAEDVTGTTGSSGSTSSGAAPTPPSGIVSNPCGNGGGACSGLSCTDLKTVYESYRRTYLIAKTKQLKDALIDGLALLGAYMASRGCGF
jgi:hypothetical protein